MEEKKKPTKTEKLAQLRSDFAKFLYRKEGDQPAVVMGRTAKSWGKELSYFAFICAVLLSVSFPNRT